MLKSGGNQSFFSSLIGFLASFTECLIKLARSSGLMGSRVSENCIVGKQMSQFGRKTDFEMAEIRRNGKNNRN